MHGEPAGSGADHGYPAARRKHRATLARYFLIGVPFWAVVLGVLDSRKLTLAFAAARGLFGVGLLAVPERLASGWIPDDHSRPQTQMIVRGIGGRDIALAGGTIRAVGTDDDVRPWLLAAIASDGSDILASLLTGDSLPGRAKKGTLALAGVAVACGAALVAAES